MHKSQLCIIAQVGPKLEVNELRSTSVSASVIFSISGLPDQCQMPINADQNSGIDPNVDISDQCHDFDRH